MTRAVKSKDNKTETPRPPTKKAKISRTSSSANTVNEDDEEEDEVSPLAQLTSHRKHGRSSSATFFVSTPSSATHRGIPRTESLPELRMMKQAKQLDNRGHLPPQALGGSTKPQQPQEEDVQEKMPYLIKPVLPMDSYHLFWQNLSVPDELKEIHMLNLESSYNFVQKWDEIRQEKRELLDRNPGEVVGNVLEEWLRRQQFHDSSHLREIAAAERAYAIKLKSEMDVLAERIKALESKLG